MTGLRTRLAAPARVSLDVFLAAALAALWLSETPTPWLLLAFLAVAVRAFLESDGRSTVIRATVVTLVGGGIMIRLNSRDVVPTDDVLEIPLIAVLTYLFAGFAWWRSRVERIVLREHERLAKLVDALPLATIAFDSDAHVVTWNRMAEDLFGWKRDDVVGKKNPSVPPQHRVATDDLHRRVIEGETLRGIEVERRNAAGDVLELSVFSAPLDPDLGPHAGFLALYDDIGERKRAERERDEAQNRYRELIEALPLVTYIDHVDEHATNEYTSPQIAELLGWTADDWAANPTLFEELLHPDDTERVMTQVAHANTTRERFESEYRLRHKDGGYVWVRDHSEIVEGAGGEVFARGFLLDITKQKLLEEQLLQAQKLDALGQLAGGFAHDFNNLLTAISGYAELASGAAGEDAALLRCLEGIGAAVAEAAGLTTRLLSFSRQTVIERRVVDLNDVVRNAVALLERRVPANVGIGLELAREPLLLSADEAQLQQVVVNLALNAFEAMAAEGGTLTVTTAASGEAVELRIEDTGSGMTPETRARALEPFFTTKPAREGSGLGLAVAYGIVDSLGGSLSIASSLGDGTTVTATLPGVSKDATPVPTGPEERDGARRVLIVEDREIVRELARDILVSAGFDAVTAASGDEALAIAVASEDAFDLLLTDVVMPKMSGPELAQKVRERFAGLPVLYMSGYTDDVLDAGALAEPATGFLRKPFANADLIAKAHELGVDAYCARAAVATAANAPPAATG